MREYELEMKDEYGHVIRRVVPEGATIQPPIPPGVYTWRARLAPRLRGPGPSAWTPWSEVAVNDPRQGRAIVFEAPADPPPDFTELRLRVEEWLDG